MRANPNVIDGKLVYRVRRTPGGNYVLEGLPDRYGNADTDLVFRDHQGVVGDIDSPGAMQGALYDVCVWSQELEDAARGYPAVVFLTPLGRFEWAGPGRGLRRTDGLVRGNPNVIGDALVYRVRGSTQDGFFVEDLPQGRETILMYWPTWKPGGRRYGSPEVPRDDRTMAEALLYLCSNDVDLLDEYNRRQPVDRVVFLTPLGRFSTDYAAGCVVKINPEEEPVRGLLANPARSRRPREARPPEFDRAKNVVEGFNARDMRVSGKFEREIVVPVELPLGGPVLHVTYRSDKWNEGTHDYIHTIESQPHVKVAIVGGRGPKVRIPEAIRSAVTLSQIGTRALGFAYQEDGEHQEVTVSGSAQWYWSPTAKALYLIEGRRRLLAVIWGGKLDVQPRGIVG